MYKIFNKSNIFASVLLFAFIAALFFCDGLYKNQHGMRHQESQNQQQDSHQSMIVAIQPSTADHIVKLKLHNFVSGLKLSEPLVQVRLLLLMSVILLLWQIIGKLRNYLSWWRSRGLLNPKIYTELCTL